MPSVSSTLTAPPLGAFRVAVKALVAKSTCPEPVTVAFSDDPVELFAWIDSVSWKAAVLALVVVV